MSRFKFVFLLSLASCSGTISHFTDDQRQRDAAFHEMRSDIGDLKHSLQACRTELQILQDRILDQENHTKTALRKQQQSEQLQSQIASIERKMLAMEKSLERFSGDLRGLNKHAEQTNLSLASFKEKVLTCQKELATVNQLKSTLTQISHAIESRSAKQPRSSSYKVKPGDTLEKIARSHNISTTALKRINNISQDKILVGQELKVSDDGE